MPSELEVYESHADRYEELIRWEDYQGNILETMKRILPLEGRIAVDLGAGTGRLARLLTPQVSYIHAFDASRVMLRICREQLASSGSANWNVGVADHRHIPLSDRTLDLVVSGWSVSYLAVWNSETWRSELEQWMEEMNRVLLPAGWIVLFESLGTGNETPLRLDHLRKFYSWLDETGFQNTWIRTDYRFESIEQAEKSVRFFFGDELGDRVRKYHLRILPECTGVWWKQTVDGSVT
ncbi:MAG: class I SAM-dependent methyltransferase [Chloroflexi bacterium]|nr:class I SAM-dependent methyltransferase [Chloroflexota bacterium]